MNDSRQPPELLDHELDRPLKRALQGPRLSEEQRDFIWQKLAGGLENRSGKNPRPSIQISPLWRWLLGGAAAAIALLIISLSLTPTEGDQQDPWVNTSNEVRTCALSDGTVIDVYPGAKLAWLLDEDTRGVSLFLGEIKLNVSPESRPLIVSKSTAKITVVGTRFQIRVAKISTGGNHHEE